MSGCRIETCPHIMYVWQVIPFGIGERKGSDAWLWTIDASMIPRYHYGIRVSHTLQPLPPGISTTAKHKIPPSPHRAWARRDCLRWAPGVISVALLAGFFLMVGTSAVEIIESAL